MAAFRAMLNDLEYQKRVAKMDKKAEEERLKQEAQEESYGAVATALTAGLPGQQGETYIPELNAPLPSPQPFGGGSQYGVEGAMSRLMPESSRVGTMPTELQSQLPGGVPGAVATTIPGRAYAPAEFASVPGFSGLNSRDVPAMLDFGQSRYREWQGTEEETKMKAEEAKAKEYIGGLLPASLKKAYEAGVFTPTSSYLEELLTPKTGAEKAIEFESQAQALTPITGPGGAWESGLPADLDLESQKLAGRAYDINDLPQPPQDKIALDIGGQSVWVDPESYLSNLLSQEKFSFDQTKFQIGQQTKGNLAPYADSLGVDPEDLIRMAQERLPSDAMIEVMTRTDTNQPMYDPLTDKPLLDAKGDPVMKSSVTRSQKQGKQGDLKYQGAFWDEVRGKVSNPATSTGNGGGGMRTDRHNNPTAMTTDVAKTLGLVEGVDYERGDSFGDGSLYTARLLGDGMQTTIEALDKAANDPGKMAFYTAGGKPRWTYTAISDEEWLAMSPDEKVEFVNGMYQNEGGAGNGQWQGGEEVAPETGGDSADYKAVEGWQEWFDGMVSWAKSTDPNITAQSMIDDAIDAGFTREEAIALVQDAIQQAIKEGG